MSKELDQAKQSKIGLENINHPKVLKRAETFNNIGSIKSEKQRTDTDSIEHKFSWEAVTSMLEIN